MINLNSKSDVVIISGATASGKSDFAINLALKAKKAIIINADSAQIYTDAPILSNIPKFEQQHGIVHQLFAIKSIVDDFSVMMWLNLVKQAVEQAQQNEALPIIVGGSAMYLFSLLEGISKIPSSPSARLEAEALYHKLGHLEFLSLVSSVDPDFTIRFQDKQRLIRAYEVFLCSHQPFSSWQSQPKQKIVNANFIHLYINKKRDLLYHDIDLRFEQMLQDGALNEVKKILKITNSPTYLKKILGLYDLSLYLQDKTSLTEAICTCKQKSRNYAKRQITFLQNKIKSKIMIDIKNNVSNITINILN